MTPPPYAAIRDQLSADSAPRLVSSSLGRVAGVDLASRPPRTGAAPESADCLLFPELLWDLNDPAAIRRTLAAEHARAAQCGKRLLAFLCHDTTEPVTDLPQARLFRTSLERSRRLANEQPLPYVWDCRDEAFAPLPAAAPSVSFFGFARSHPVRPAALDRLRASGLGTDFVVRDAFWGGKPHDPQLIADYWANMERSLFVLSCRGAGNFSIRFFQALSAGRIPVAVDTDLVLPCPAEIDWPRAVVLAPSVEERPAAIRRFCVTTDLVAAQHRCRQVFDAHLSQTGFARWLTRWLQAGGG